MKIRIRRVGNGERELSFFTGSTRKQNLKKKKKIKAKTCAERGRNEEI